MLITTAITTQIRLSSKQPISKSKYAGNDCGRDCSCASTKCQNIKQMPPFKAMNIQYEDLHQPGSPCYWQLRIKRLKPHPFDVFSWPLFYLLLWGVELKGSMTTRQGSAQCVLRGQDGRYTSACWEGFLRTSTHWYFSITLWLRTRIRKRTIQMLGTSPKENKKYNNPVSDRKKE